MNKKHNIAIFLLFTLFITFNLIGSGDLDITKIFPEIKGMKKQGTPDIYTPDNLYEYINGAADVFLSYDFQKLAVLNYEDQNKHSLTIDIYRHSNKNNGFGIYSQEKPAKGDFLDIGAQGYYEQGVLNFFSGVYYVKMSAYDLGDNEKPTMMAAAKAITQKFSEKNSFPKTLSFFPTKGMKPNTQRYVAADFLGHSFLHSAFVSDYEVDGKKYQVFIMETPDPKDTQKIIDSYSEFAKGKGNNVSQKSGIISFLDPYYRSSGMMNLKYKGRYVWGTFGDDEHVLSFINDIDKKIASLK